MECNHEKCLRDGCSVCCYCGEILEMTPERIELLASKATAKVWLRIENQPVPKNFEEFLAQIGNELFNAGFKAGRKG